MWWKLPYDIVAANMDAQRVIALRLAKLARGGPRAETEARQMVAEKRTASMEAGISLAAGKSLSSVVRRYRTIMHANERRLSGRRR